MENIRKIQIIKIDLERRHIYAKSTDHVEGYFMVLLISRILELKLDNNYSTREIQE